jgi:tetratricopeptide (TPR) repeat protein
MRGLGGPTVRESIKVKLRPARVYEIKCSLRPLVSKESAGHSAVAQVGRSGSDLQTPLQSCSFIKVIPLSIRRDFIIIVALIFAAGLCFAEQSQLKTAKVLLSKGDLKEAVPLLRQIVQAEPQSSDAHMLLGTALALQGLRTESLEEMHCAVRLQPDSAVVHNALGRVLSRFLEAPAAKSEFETALALDSNFAEAHVNLALVLAQSGELQAAGEHLDRAIHLQGETKAAAYTHYLRAKVARSQDDLLRSTTELQKAVQLQPDYSQAWLELGELLFHTPDRRGALEAFKKAVSLSPNNSAAQSKLGELELEDGHSAEAIKHLKLALSSGAENKAALYLLTRALRREGQFEEAKQVEKRMLELQHREDSASEAAVSASDLNSQGMALEKSNDSQSALAKYKAALDLDPSDVVFRLNYALALCRLGRWKEGAVELREVLRVDPDNYDAARALNIANEELAKEQAMSTPH